MWIWVDGSAAKPNMSWSHMLTLTYLNFPRKTAPWQRFVISLASRTFSPLAITARLAPALDRGPQCTWLGPAQLAWLALPLATYSGQPASLLATSSLNVWLKPAALVAKP